MERKLIWFVLLLGLVIAAIASVSSATGNVSYGSNNVTGGCRTYPVSDLARAAENIVIGEVRTWAGTSQAHLYIAYPEVIECRSGRDAKYLVKLLAVKGDENSTGGYAYIYYRLTFEGTNILDAQESRGTGSSEQELVSRFIPRVYKMVNINVEECIRYPREAVARMGYADVMGDLIRWLGGNGGDIYIGYPTTERCYDGMAHYLVPVVGVKEENGESAYRAFKVYLYATRRGIELNRAISTDGTTHNVRELISTLIPELYKKIHINRTTPSCTTYPASDVARAAEERVINDAREWLGGKTGNLYISYPKLVKCRGGKAGVYVVSIVGIKFASPPNSRTLLYAYKAYKVTLEGTSVVDVEETEGSTPSEEEVVARYIQKLYKKITLGEEECIGYAKEKVSKTAFAKVERDVREWLGGSEGDVYVGYPIEGECKVEQVSPSPTSAMYKVRTYMVPIVAVKEVNGAFEYKAFKVSMVGLRVETTSATEGRSDNVESLITSLIPRLYKKIHVNGNPQPPAQPKIVVVVKGSSEPDGVALVYREDTMDVVAIENFYNMGSQWGAEITFEPNRKAAYRVEVAALGGKAGSVVIGGGNIYAEPIITYDPKDGSLLVSYRYKVEQKTYTQPIRKNKPPIKPVNLVEGSTSSSPSPVIVVRKAVESIARKKFGEIRGVQIIGATEVSGKPYYKAIVEKPVKLFNIIPLPFTEKKIIYVGGDTLFNMSNATVSG